MNRLQSWAQSFPDQLKVITLVESSDELVNAQNLAVGRISEVLLRDVLRNCRGRTMVLVCGPDG